MIKRTAILLTALLLLTILYQSSVSAAMPSAPTITLVNENLLVVDQLAGSVTALATDEAVVYVAVGPRLYMLEQSSSGHLVELGHSPILAGAIEAIHLSDQYIFLAAGFAGLYQLDGQTLAVIDQHDSRGYANRLTQIDQRLFVADWSAGLLGFDLQSGLAQPTIQYNPGIVTGVAAAPDGDLILALGFAGTQRVDLTNPQQPDVVASLAEPGWDVFAGNDFVIVNNGYGGGGTVLETGEPDILTLLAQLPINDVISSWHLAARTLWLATEGGELYQIELADPALPQTASIATGLEPMMALDAIQGQLLMASKDSGLSLMALGNGVQTAPAGQWPIPAIITDVDLQGRYLYEAAAYQGLIIVDKRDMRAVAQLPLLARANAVKVHGQFAYVATAAGLFTVDISNPLAPELVGHIETAGQAQAIAIDGQYLLLADGPAGIHLYHLDNAANPQYLTSFSNGHDVQDVFIYEGYAYAAAWNGVQILQILDPGTLHYNYQVDTSGYARSVTVSEDILYIADWHGLQLVDVSNLQLITNKGYIQLPGQVQDVFFQNGMVFVALGEAGVVVLDGPESRVTAAYDTAGNAASLLPVQDQLYVADENGGLLQLELTNFVYQTYLPIWVSK